MAYMSQDYKKKLAPGIKAVLKKHGIKGSIGVENHTTLVVNLKSGLLDIVQNYNTIAKEKGNRCYDEAYIQVNHYYLDTSYYGKVLSFLQELDAAMNIGNFDKSDSQSDYFNVGWYISINVGKWNKEYEVM